MQVQNLQIFSSTLAANGSWIDISNLVSFSVHITGIEVATTIEVSNDPNVMIDGSAVGAPGSAPTLLQYPAGAGFQSGVSNLPAATFFVTTTFITKWGETTASSESSLAVSAGNYLLVVAPVPTAAQAPHVTGWNIYVSLSTGTEVLQTAPPYSPQRLIDGVGSAGGTVNPLGPGQSTHFAISGALPLAQNFSMLNGFQNTGISSPSLDASGGAGLGVQVAADLSTATTADLPIAIFADTNNSKQIMWSPSNMNWKWLRVTKSAATQTKLTTAYLCGVRG